MGQFKIWLGEAKTLDLNVHRITSKNINTWQERLIFSVNEYNPQALIDEIRTNRDRAYEHTEEVFKRWQTEKDKDFYYWYNEESKTEARVLAQLYDRDLKNMAMMYFGLTPLEVEALIPGFATRLFCEIKDRLKEKGISGEENLNKRLAKFLHSAEF